MYATFCSSSTLWEMDIIMIATPSVKLFFRQTVILGVVLFLVGWSAMLVWTPASEIMQYVLEFVTLYGYILFGFGSSLWLLIKE